MKKVIEILSSINKQEIKLWHWMALFIALGVVRLILNF